MVSEVSATLVLTMIFGLLAGGDGGVLILRCQFTMQRHHSATPCKRTALDCCHGLADLVTARHENEHVPIETGRVREVFAGAGRLIPDRLGVAGFELQRSLISNFDRKRAALGFEQLAGLHEIHQRPWDESGRHDDDLQIRPLALQTPCKSQHEIAIQMTLMKFVDYDAADAIQHRVFKQHAQHHAFGDVGQPCLATGDVFKAHLITDFPTETSIALACDSLRQHAGGDAAWLEHHATFSLRQDA
jgi:hypothetical protein